MLKIKLVLNDKEYNNFKKYSNYNYDVNAIISDDIYKHYRIKMEDIKNIYIPLIESDIFISYSHDDTEKAKLLANELQTYGLKTFVDCLYWKSIDDALKQYDNLYSLSDDCSSSKTYNYEKRNKSTSTFHMILADSLIDIIKKSDVYIMLYSENYMNDDKRTYSPWIYLENKVAKSFENEWKHMNRLIHDSIRENYAISFPIDDNDFLVIKSFQSLIQVLKKYYDYKKDR